MSTLTHEIKISFKVLKSYNITEYLAKLCMVKAWSSGLHDLRGPLEIVELLRKWSRVGGA